MTEYNQLVSHHNKLNTYQTTDELMKSTKNSANSPIQDENVNHDTVPLIQELQICV